MVWLAVFEIFNVHTDVDACDCTRGLYGHRTRVSAGSWLWERKIPCRTGDSNPRLYCARLFSRTLYQLNYFGSQNSFTPVQIASAEVKGGSQFWIRTQSTTVTETKKKNSQQRAHLFLQFTSLQGTEVYVLLLDSPRMHSDTSIRTRFPTQALLNNTLYCVDSAGAWKFIN